MKTLLIREAESVYQWGQRNGGDKELSCWCAITSYELFKRFRRQRLNPTFYKVSDGWNLHCFVSCMGYIVDVTARQFTRAVKTIEVRKTNPDFHWFWQTEENDFVDVYKAQTTAGIQKLLKKWPAHQNPFMVDFKRNRA